MVKFSEIELAFEFVSSGPPLDRTAYLSLETGETYFRTEVGDNFEELPDDIDDRGKYIAIPHKNDLGLGKPLVLKFSARFLSDEYREVAGIFQRQGAYRKFKRLLERRGTLNAWYEFESEAQREALPPECSLTDASAAEVAVCEFSSQVSGRGWFESWPAELRQYIAETMAMAAASPPNLPPDSDVQDIEFPSTCDDDVRLAMARHAIPILFIRGEQMPAWFQAALEEYEACLPPHESATAPGASHFVHIDQAAQYNRALIKSFDQIGDL